MTSPFELTKDEDRFLRELDNDPSVAQEDKRKIDRHKPGRKRPKPKGGWPKKPSGKLSKWKRRLVVAWDGEGANLESGEHVYNLLANSDGTHILNHQGLTTVQCFEFFLCSNNHLAINVIYGGSYDVNMLLVDLTTEHLKQLWITGRTRWGPYSISYTPRKMFSLKKWKPGVKKPIAEFVLWDVIGYFQCTFVVACRKWLGELPQLTEIERMKYERDVFSIDRINEILHYNQQECALLVLLMTALFDAMDEAGIRLTRYDGAGSIAAALLRIHDIQPHMGNYPQEIGDKPSESIVLHAQYAYSGGRIEAIKLGTSESPIYRYDINSAYPSTARALPSYKDAVWSLGPWDGGDHSIVEVEWDLTSYNLPFYPLWVRDHWGTITYPATGEGRYFGCEVKNLTRYFTEGIDFWYNQPALNVKLSCKDYPFAFIDKVYEQRLKFKAEGRMASEALKLGMNSLYGKLAQQAGFRSGRIPTYHHLLWAGEITAQTRALMFQAGMQNPDAVIAFATDAVVSDEPLDLPCGKGLGEWSPEELEGITIVQAGVYWLKAGGEWHDKYRGFDKNSLNREGIIQCWRDGSSYEASLTRFVGMGAALSSVDLRRVWRKWITMPRVLNVQPTGKRIPGEATDYYNGLRATLPTDRGSYNSQPYPIAWIDGPRVMRAKVDPITGLADPSGMDIRDYEQEMEDQYA